MLPRSLRALAVAVPWVQRAAQQLALGRSRFPRVPACVVAPLVWAPVPERAWLCRRAPLASRASWWHWVLSWVFLPCGRPIRPGAIRRLSVWPLRGAFRQKPGASFLWRVGRRVWLDVSLELSWLSPSCRRQDQLPPPPPRIRGMPLGPLPITTVLALGDFASSRVASIPAHRNTDGVRDELTVSL